MSNFLAFLITLCSISVITVKMSIPLVMGANIGTSITNTIVSMAQAGDRNEFRRAFAAATVLDMFNWLTVIILLPLEAATGYLLWLTSLITQSIELQGQSSNIELLVVLTRPFTHRIIQVFRILSSVFFFLFFFLFIIDILIINFRLVISVYLSLPFCSYISEH